MSTTTANNKTSLLSSFPSSRSLHSHCRTRRHFGTGVLRWMVVVVLSIASSSTTLLSSSSSSLPSLGCQAFVFLSPGRHPHRTNTKSWPTSTSLRDYEDDYTTAGNTNMYIYTPDIVPRVQPDSRIKEWIRPRQPSYMPDQEYCPTKKNNDNHYHHHQQPQQQQQQQYPAQQSSHPRRQQQQQPPPPPPSQPDWSHYMTVSEEVLANPDEITKPKLAQTAPPQPTTPSPEEFLFAEIKDLVVRGGNFVNKDMADPRKFHAYMTVSEPQPAPPAAFVDAEIVNEEEEQNDNDDDDDDDDKEHTASTLASVPFHELSAETYVIDDVNRHNPDKSPPSSSSRMMTEQQEEEDPVAKFEQNFPESPVTMKQLAEEYRRREQQQYVHHQHHHHLHSSNNNNNYMFDASTSTSSSYFASSHQQQQHSFSQPGPFLDNNANTNYYYSYQQNNSNNNNNYHHRTGGGGDQSSATAASAAATPSGPRQYHIPMPDLEDLAREWMSMQTTTTAQYPTSPLPPSPSMEELAEVWVRMTYNGNQHESS
eukprot:scaffold6387_cov171-Amphora_coffeaeformis.AAC.3